jgi:hypothetical protein
MVPLVSDGPDGQMSTMVWAFTAEMPVGQVVEEGLTLVPHEGRVLVVASAWTLVNECAGPGPATIGRPVFLGNSLPSDTR